MNHSTDQARPEPLLLSVLTRIQAAQKLYQTEQDYEPHQLDVEEAQDELLDVLCPPDSDAVLDLSPLLAQANAEAELRARVEGLRGALADAADALEYAITYMRQASVNTGDEEEALSRARVALAPRPEKETK